ncbi:MAG: hydroxyacylglutathione hydrolase [Myxococcota bacterium]
MSHVVSSPPPPFRVAGGALEVHAVPAATDNLVWLLRCTATGEVAVVDGPDAQAAQAWCEAHGARLSAIWNTHTHPDHIGINRALQEQGALPPAVVGPRAVAGDIPGLTRGVGEGDEVRLGAVTARVWETPGHIRGHVSYVVDGAVFCGDTMFAGGCGRIFDGTPEQLFTSLRRLAELPPDTLVCCAHEYTQDNLRFAWSVEPDNAELAERIRRVWAVRADGRSAVPSTIATERATNPFLRPGSPAVAAAVGGGDAQAVFTALRKRKDEGAYRDAGDAGLPPAAP